ncbi:hypothetical protein [Thiopseudomonas denitrificans]|uniref:Uncharacterized protein n=1 Tax=Thiopseudomonas denitrificans TaxID=1501432 RepID=A0A4R6U175_9GAMM|nr:hypothetical protein [Thiopseudomonas denitrificans]TDQ40060.1 hypothetical protein DFQ45_101193 [Thiopseudomonas denitrificans]
MIKTTGTQSAARVCERSERLKKNLQYGTGIAGSDRQQRERHMSIIAHVDWMVT